jgi:hypothetical protein
VRTYAGDGSCCGVVLPERSRRYGETGPGDRSRSIRVSLITRLFSPFSISTCLFIHRISLSTPSESLSCSPPLPPPLLPVVLYLQFFSCSTTFCTKMDANEWDSILQFVADGLAQDTAPSADETAFSIVRPPLSRSVSATQIPTPPVRDPLL